MFVTAIRVKLILYKVAYKLLYFAVKYTGVAEPIQIA